MLRRKWVQGLCVLGVLLLGIVGWIIWALQLTPSEAALVGTWTTTRQPDGFSTVIVFGPNRTCRIRWLGDTGMDNDPGHPPREGKWWVEDGTVVVDATLQPNWYDTSFWEFQRRRQNTLAFAWRFAIQEEGLILGVPGGAAMKGPSVMLRRKADVRP